MALAAVAETYTSNSHSPNSHALVETSSREKNCWQLWWLYTVSDLRSRVNWRYCIPITLTYVTSWWPDARRNLRAWSSSLCGNSRNLAWAARSLRVGSQAPIIYQRISFLEAQPRSGYREMGYGNSATWNSLVTLGNMLKSLGIVEKQNVIFKLTFPFFLNKNLCYWTSVWLSCSFQFTLFQGKVQLCHG